jgi:hypothetical protein
MAVIDKTYKTINAIFYDNIYYVFFLSHDILFSHVKDVSKVKKPVLCTAFLIGQQHQFML